MSIELNERVLSDVLRSLRVADDHERRPEDRAIFGLEEDRVCVVDVGHRASSRRAGDTDSALPNDSLHIASREPTVTGAPRCLLHTYGGLQPNEGWQQVVQRLYQR